MAEQSLDNNAPLPKGVGISAKLFLILISCIGVILGLVIAIIFYYRSQPDNKPTQTQHRLVQQQSGLSPEDAIHQLNQSDEKGVLVAPKKDGNNPATGNTTTASTATPKSLTSPNPNVATPKTIPDGQVANTSLAIVNNYRGPTQLPDDSAHQNNNEDIGNSVMNRSTTGNATGSTYQAQNMQTEKTAFLSATQKANNQFYLDSRVTKPVSPYEIKAGTIIPATMLTGINSDLPGEITAQVSRSIYDTVTGNYLLIPQGTRLIGIYDSQVAYGQARVLIAWSRLIFPNGNSFDLEGQPGVDLAGMAGLHDLVNNHYFRIFGSALLFSLFGAAGQLSQPQQSGNVLTNQQIIYGAVGQQMSQTGAQLIQKNMNIQPTLQIRPGAEFNVLLTKDMIMPGSYK